MTFESKNVYNFYLFCLNFFNKIKVNLFRDLINEIILNLDITGVLGGNLNLSDINEKIQLKLSEYYTKYTKTYRDIKHNNNVIYDYIKTKKINVYHDNFNDILQTLLLEIAVNKENDLLMVDQHYKYMYYEIVANILKSFYSKNYFALRDCILHKKPYNKLYPP